MSGSFVRRLIQTTSVLAMVVAGPLSGAIIDSASSAQNVSASVQSTAPTQSTVHLQPIAQVEASLAHVVENTVAPASYICDHTNNCQVNLPGQPGEQGTVVYGPNLLPYNMEHLHEKYYRVHYTWSDSRIFNTKDDFHRVTFGAWKTERANEFYSCVRTVGDKEPLLVLFTGGKGGDDRMYYVFVLKCDGKIHEILASAWDNMDIGGHGGWTVHDQHPAVALIYPQDCKPVACVFKKNQITFEWES